MLGLSGDVVGIRCKGEGLSGSGSWQDRWNKDRWNKKSASPRCCSSCYPGWVHVHRQRKTVEMRIVACSGVQLTEQE